MMDFDFKDDCKDDFKDGFKDDFKDEQLAERTLSSKQVYDGRLLKVFCDKVSLPNGHESTREYIKHNGAVCVVAITDDGKIIVEHQYRYPFEKVIVEIPAGKLDSATEDHLEAAQRELREETGFTAKNWQYMGPFSPTVAYSSETIYMYLATGLEKGERELDDDEFLNVIKVPFEDFKKTVMEGKVIDGKTIAAVLMAANILGE